VLGSPVGAGVWYASEGCCSDDTHHRRGLVAVNGQLMVPQRFAIDWFKLDARHRAWVGNPHKLTSYLSFLQPVYAAADGVVVGLQNGLPDNRPPEPPPIPPIADTVGNHIVIKVAPGVYLLYAHLQNGSLRVHVGEHVRVGQMIARIGNSGNSTTPHLHFQIMTRPTFFPTDSRPYVFSHFDLIGQVTKRIWDDNIGLQPTGVLPFVAARRPGSRVDELPLDRNVVRFP
jgi:Peptidase family M23